MFEVWELDQRRGTHWRCPIPKEEFQSLIQCCHRCFIDLTKETHWFIWNTFSNLKSDWIHQLDSCSSQSKADPKLIPGGEWSLRYAKWSTSALDKLTKVQWNITEITSDDRSAPVRRLHSSRCASAAKSTSDEMGLLRACAFNIETRSSALGKGTKSFFPNLPGRRTASSITSILQKRVCRYQPSILG